jgi:hypothetical protein
LVSKELLFEMFGEGRGVISLVIIGDSSGTPKALVPVP